MLEACRTIRCARSNNRGVLGSMNDIRFHIELHVAHDGGLASVDLVDLHHRVNRILLSVVGYRYPIQGLREHLAHAS